jgi:sugar O-acyltransferase (sialic acid O-acetyltransferase NeuD family)
MKLAFIGFGDLGHYIRDLVIEAPDVVGPGPYEIVIFDDGLHNAGVQGAHAFQRYADQEFASAKFFVCLGYRHLKIKLEIVDKLLSLGRELPSYVHPSAYVHPTVKLGAGSFVYPGCNIDRNTTVGRGTWITNCDVIAHDCLIGDACWFGASVTLSGKVVVGSRTFIGSGATLSNALTIGDDALIGLSSCITKNVSSGQSVIGNPMRVLERPLKLI